MYKRLLVFGILFALFGGYMLCNSIPSETAQIGHQRISQAEVREEFLISIFFILIGTGVAVHSAIHVLRDRNTDVYGREAYGIISDIMDSGHRINDVVQWKAWILVAKENGDLFEMSESIGDNRSRYKIGHFVQVKYTDRDVNILQKVGRSSLPAGVANILEEAYQNTPSE